MATADRARRNVVELTRGRSDVAPRMNTILTRLSADLIEKYEAEGFWKGDTIYGLVRWHAEHTPQAFAVRDRYRRLTYAQLLAATDALAADLARYDVRPGQRVGVWMPSRLESVVALL